MSAPPALPTADSGAAAIAAAQKRKLDDAALAAADLQAAAKQLRPDVAAGGAAAGAAFLNAAMLSGGLCCGLPVVGPAAAAYHSPVAPLLTPAAAATTAAAAPQSAAAFVAGAAAVTQALFQQQQQLLQRSGGQGAAAAGGAAGAAAAAGGGGGTTGTATGEGATMTSAAAGPGKTTEGGGGSDVLAADIARAAAAAAAAVSARQSTANTAAKAFQMALKTAELLQGTAGAGMAASPATGAAGPEPSTHTRHARKVYVGNLPVPVTQAEVQQYFNELLDSLLPNKVPGQTIVHVYVNGARRFAFLEHRSIEEANFTIGLDGISWRNCCLSLRRPQDYNATLAEQQYQEERARQGSLTGFAVPPPSAAASAAAAPHSALIAGALGIVSTTVPDSPHKIFIGGLPHSITEPACKQLLEAFGQLRALHVVKDPQRGDCKGFAFCEYLDPNVTDVAVAGLNNMRIGDRVLQVRRAMPHGHMKGIGPDGNPVCPPVAPSIVGTLSRVIAIHNMLPPLPLVPKLLRDAVATEARIRASAYGEVVCVDVQEALATQAAAKGEGVPVLVEFKDVDTAIQAMSGIQGSTYDGRSLSVVFSEPSAAMKKAAVMRIVMEAGASPLPARLTPSPSPGTESSQPTPSEPTTNPADDSQSEMNREKTDQQAEHRQQQAKKMEGQQVKNEEEQQVKKEDQQAKKEEQQAKKEEQQAKKKEEQQHAADHWKQQKLRQQPEGQERRSRDPNAEAAAEQPQTGICCEVMKEVTASKTGEKETVSPSAAGVKEGAHQQAGAAAASSSANRETHASRVSSRACAAAEGAGAAAPTGRENRGETPLAPTDKQEGASSGGGPLVSPDSGRKQSHSAVEEHKRGNASRGVDGGDQYKSSLP